MEERISDRLAKIKTDLESKTNEPESRWRKAKRVTKILALPLVLAGAIGTYLYVDYATKRQDYPERYALIKTENIVKIAGNPEKRAAERADMESIIKFFEGGGGESKIGTQLAETKRVIRGDMETFTMYDSQNNRIATSTQKTERFQVGLRFGGATSFREQFAEIILSSKSKAPQKYMVYKVNPERGWQTNDIDVVEFPFERGLKENEPGIIEEKVDEQGRKTKDLRIMVNRLVETRNTLGFFYGKFYRDKTFLEDFLNTPENKQLAQEFFETTGTLNSQESRRDLSKRDVLVKKLLGIEKEMHRGTIYSTSEDGFFKVLPQGSEIYLGENPGFWKRAKHYFFGWTRNESRRLRVNNHWDFFPFGFGAGDYPFLNKIPFGKGKDRSYPFDKYNNGGYSIHDKFGEIARVEIKDFWISYGQDVVYSYYLDLNGDGKIDRKNELIGSVLCRTTHDEKTEIQRLGDEIIPDHDITIATNYSFMAPDADLIKGWEYFKLCAYIETMMPDQVHRGTGQHSLLGFINDQRSDEMLRREPGVENLSRALTQESTLVAKYDIIRILNKTGRGNYAEELASDWGIYDEFKSEYWASSLLQERTELGAGPLLMIYLACGIGGLYGLKKGIRSYKDYKQRKKGEESIKEKLARLGGETI